MRTHSRAEDSEKGIAVLLALFVVLIVSVLGTSMLSQAETDMLVSDNYRSQQMAFYAAEAGLEQLAFDLQLDAAWIHQMTSAGGTVLSPFPSSVTIGARTVTLATRNGAVVPGWYPLGTETTLPGGEVSYRLEVFLPPENAPDGRLSMAMRSSGRTVANVESAASVVRSVGLFDIGNADSIWDNIIFSDFGKSGGKINGHVDIRGSVHILGDPSGGSVIDLGGTAGIRNNYAGMRDSVRDKLPALDTVTLNGEEVQTLGTTVHLRDAEITLSGNAEIGSVDNPGNAYKETIDAVYSDAGAIDPPSDVHTDSWVPYQSDFEFPYLADAYTDPQTGITWDSHRDFIDATALPLAIQTIDSGTASFSYSDGKNSISWDKDTRELTVDGIFKITGDLTLAGVDYRGTGTLVATGDVHLAGNLRPVGQYLGDGANDGNLGIIAGGSIEQDTVKAIDAIAAFYAQDEFQIEKKTVVAGGIVAGTFNLGRNVPTVAHVPLLPTKLPPGMPGAGGTGGALALESGGWFQEH